MMRSSDWYALDHFEAEEFDFPEKMDRELLRMLDQARRYTTSRFIITSDYRVDESPENGPESTHELGKAVDLRAHDGRSRLEIVRALLQAGFRRVGVYDRHVHADVATEADGFPQDVLWVGRSR